MRWLRLYTDILDSRKAQKLPASVFKFWINLLLTAAKSDAAKGEIPSVEDLAFGLRLSEEEVRAGLEILESAGFVDRCGETFRMHDWNEWQSFESTNAERQKRYRERNASRNVTRNVTRDATRNGEVTPTVTAKAIDRNAERQERHRRNGKRNGVTVAEVTAPAKADVTVKEATKAGKTREKCHDGRSNVTRNVTVTPLELRTKREKEKKIFKTGGGEFPPPPLEKNSREPDDQNEFDGALALLRGVASTADLAATLDASRDLPEVSGLEGWRFGVAARAVQRPGRSRDWWYFLAVAKKARHEEAARPSPASPGEQTPAPAFPAGPKTRGQKWREAAEARRAAIKSSLESDPESEPEAGNP